MAQDKVRFGVIGIGNMGSSHVIFIDKGKDCVLTAVCDCNPKAFDRIPADIRGKVKCYDEASKLINDPEVDVVVALFLLPFPIFYYLKPLYWGP